MVIWRERVCLPGNALLECVGLHFKAVHVSAGTESILSDACTRFKNKTDFAFSVKVTVLKIKSWETKRDI